jgi:YesN/AraC family two-component response regulator
MNSVLIVEDNPIFRNTLRDFLAVEFPSVRIEEASNGQEALSKFREVAPSLILMDIKLPDINGLELTRMIKKTSQETDVVILTSYNIPEYHEAALQSGACRFLTKGNVGADEIKCVVSSILASANEGCTASLLHC